MLFDKKSQDGLNLAALMISEAMQIDYDFWFQISEGDKDTFVRTAATDSEMHVLMVFAEVRSLGPRAGLFACPALERHLWL